MAAPRLDRLDKNFAINGSFDFWQRVAGNTTTVTNTGTAITADRMRIYQASANPLSVAVVRSTDVPTPSQVGMRLNYSYQVTNNTANNLLNSGAASEYYIPFNYTVEGYDYADISNGKKLVISFWFKSTLAGNYPLSLRNNALTRSYVTTFNYTSANVWQFVELVIESDAAGTWDYDNNRGLLIGMSWGGTQWQIPALNQWTTGASVPSYLSPTAAQVVNFPNTAGAVLRIAAFSVKRMDAALGAGEFSRSGGSYANELRLCQRYYYRLDHPFNFAGWQMTLGFILDGIAFPAEMRAVPVFSSSALTTIQAHSNGNFDGTMQAQGFAFGQMASNSAASANNKTWILQGTGPAVGPRNFNIYSNAAAAFLAWDAEY